MDGILSALYKYQMHSGLDWATELTCPAILLSLALQDSFSNKKPNSSFLITFDNQQPGNWLKGLGHTRDSSELKRFHPIDSWWTDNEADETNEDGMSQAQGLFSNSSSRVEKLMQHVLQLER